MGRLVQGADPGRPGQPRATASRPRRRRCGCAPHFAACCRGRATRSRRTASPETPAGSAPAFSRIARAACGPVSAAAASPCTRTARVRALTERDGLAPGSVWQIVQGDDDAVWFATSGGVSRYQNGRFTSVTTAHAPITAVVPVLVVDTQGYVWLGVQSGAVLMRFHAGEMDKVEKDPHHRLAYTLYDESDGLQPGTQMWQNGAAGVRDMAGRIWVADGPGMTIIDPRQLREARPASPPSLEAVTVNGEGVNPVAVRRLANGSTVQIEYAVAQPLGHLEAALPPPARRRRRGLGVRRERSARHLRQPAGRRLSLPGQRHGRRAVDRAVAVGVHRRAAVLFEPLVSAGRRRGAGRRDGRHRAAACPGGEDPLRAGERRADAREPRDPRHAAPEPGRARPRSSRRWRPAPRQAKAA